MSHWQSIRWNEKEINDVKKERLLHTSEISCRQQLICVWLCGACSHYSDVLTKRVLDISPLTFQLAQTLPQLAWRHRLIWPNLPPPAWFLPLRDPTRSHLLSAPQLELMDPYSLQSLTRTHQLSPLSLLFTPPRRLLCSQISCLPIPKWLLWPKQRQQTFNC